MNILDVVVWSDRKRVICGSWVLNLFALMKASFVGNEQAIYLSGFFLRHSYLGDKRVANVTVLLNTYGETQS